VLVSPQLSSSLQWLPSRWRIHLLLRSGYLVAGDMIVLPLRNTYLVVVGGWMVVELSIEATWSFVDGC
jgi:hypothetical protein